MDIPNSKIFKENEKISVGYETFYHFFQPQRMGIPFYRFGKTANSPTVGRPFGAKSKSLKLSKNTKKVKDLMAKGLPKAQIARLLGVDKLTLYRFLKKLKSEE